MAASQPRIGLKGVVLRPLLAVAAALVLTLGALTAASRHADSLAVEEQGRLLLNAVQQEGQTAGRLLEPIAVSDEAAQNIHARFDANWAERELLRHAALVQHDVSMIVLPDSAVGLVLAGRERQPHMQAVPLAVQLAPAIAALRGQRNAHRPQNTSIGNGQRLQVLTTLGGRPALVNLLTIVPLGHVANLPPPPLPMLIAVRYLDNPAFLRNLAVSHLLTNLRIAAPGEEPPAQVTLRDVQGLPVATLAWQPTSPGAALLADVAPYVFAGAALIGALAIWMALFAQRAVLTLAEREREAWESARTDALTGLPNRRALVERAPELLERGPTAVVMLDFDRFKRVNDAFGHAAGDRLLVTTAERLREEALKIARDTGREAVLTRLGGDEFVMLLPLLPGEGAQELLSGFQRLRRAVRQFVQLPDGETMRMGVSGGIAIAPQHGTQIEVLLRRADAALQASKRAGRGRALVFEPAHDQKHEAKLAMESALQRAIREEALHVHFQPQFDARTGVLRGAEALVRWNDPRLGSVSPAAFIPLAEEMGVMNEIALFVLRHAATVAADPRVPHVAVNLSAAQFRQDGFLAAARDVLRRAGVAPERIELEVTESVLVEDQDEVKSRFDALREAGFLLAIDDFGTGFSSLSYLRRFRFDRLKIDRSFIRDLGRDPQARALAGSIVALGHGLGLEVVAEGVESFDQLRALRDMRCDTVQGFLAGRPMSAEDFMAMVSGSTPLPSRSRVVNAATAGA